MSTDERDLKRANNGKVIGTHNGTFHCDEALAVFLLRQTNTYRDASVRRSRDSKILDTCDIVVDVGGVYDEGLQRFDHHQREFNGVFGHGFATKLSSAGLVYKHFGKEIVANRLQKSQDDAVIEVLWLKMYKEFIEGIDGIDNGVLQYADGALPRYRVKTDLSSRVSWLNPAWNEKVDSNGVDELFGKASALTGSEFLGRLDYYANAWMPARDIVLSAFNDRGNVHATGRIILFTQFAPWKEHLYEIEKEAGIAEDEKPFYIIYPDETASNWRIQAVSISPDSFENRLSLPEKWRGLRDEALSKESGIPGCIFIHSSGFIGGNATKEGALTMATRSVELLVKSA